jgi:hypothetical protein
LNTAATPRDLLSAFNTVAAKWLEGDRRVLPTALADWTGEGWKEKIRKYFQEQIAILNTPNSKTCVRLFRLFLNVDLNGCWRWSGYNFEVAAKRLDEIVRVRGEVTHLARKTGLTPTKHVVSRTDLISYLQFIKKLAEVTEKASAITPELSPALSA